jgi:penicillin-binding protein 2
VAVADSQRLRLGVLAVVVLSLFAALTGRLWYLQAIAAPSLTITADAREERTVVLPAPRGRIFDAEGRAVATNVRSIHLTVDRRTIADDDVRAALFDRLAPVLQVPVEDLHARHDPCPEEQPGLCLSAQYRPELPLPLAEGVPERVAIAIKERAGDFPGVEIEPVGERSYPYGSVGAHIVGYLGSISEESLSALRNAACPEEFGGRRVSDLDERDCGYLGNDRVGRFGVEQLFETDLRGVPGYRVLEVDARGRVLRVREEVPPIPGNDVHLTVDWDVQAFVEHQLAAGVLDNRYRIDGTGSAYPSIGGAAVVLDSITGRVVASASYPTFDPRILVSNPSREEFAALFPELPEGANPTDNPAPLVNRATQGLYAPGSTYKIVSGLAMHAANIRGLQEPFVDTPCYVSPNSTDQREFCSPSLRSATVDFREAIAVSRDTYFYSIGNDTWSDTDGPLQDAARVFGFGQNTGIALPGERRGRIASPSEFAALYAAAPEAFGRGNDNWLYGDNINAAVGQGLVAVTPMQLANAYQMIASDGVRRSPVIVDRVTANGSDDVIRSFQTSETRVPLDPAFLGALKDGLEGAVSYGTAEFVFETWNDDLGQIAGKTGTAQDVSRLDRNDTSLFASYAPADAPRYAMAVVVEKAGFGSEAAAPISRAIWEGVLQPDTIPPAGEAPALFTTPNQIVPAEWPWRGPRIQPPEASID